MEEAEYILYSFFRFRNLFVYSIALPHVTHSCQEKCLVQSCRMLVCYMEDGVTDAHSLTKYAVSAEKCLMFGLVLH